MMPSCGGSLEPYCPPVSINIMSNGEGGWHDLNAWLLDEVRAAARCDEERVGGGSQRPEAWVTKEDIESELFEEAHELMHLSGLKNLPCHKGLETDLHCGRRPALGIRHERECRAPFIAVYTVLCCISASA